MALVVEDGTIVTDANTYADVQDLEAYAEDRGVTLPSTTEKKEQLLIQAMDFIEARRAQFKGQKVDADQRLQFPRKNLFVDGVAVAEDTIPREIRYAQMQAAIEAMDADLAPSQVEPPVRQENVGPIMTIYGSSAADPWPGPSFPKIDAWLDPLLYGGGFGIEVCRV